MISKKSFLKGEITVPGSKSHTIRAVTVATLADGISYIGYPLYSEDTLSSLKCAEMLGATVLEKSENAWIIQGTGGQLKKPSGVLDVGNSGTTLRLFCALAGLAHFPITFDGDESLRTRVMSPLLNALEALGVKVQSRDQKCPITLSGPMSSTQKITLSAPSSQFLTALLFALPLAPFDTEIELSLLNEKPYVEITLDWLRSQNIQFEKQDDLMFFKIYGNQKYVAFKRTIPSDFSTATFPLVAALITHSPLTILNLDFSDSQGDKAVFDMVRKMGAKWHVKENKTFIEVNYDLHGAELDLNATPDALPALAVLASCIKGETRIVNTPQARMKETDRIACIACELKKLGVEVEEFEDGLRIVGNPQKMYGCELKGYGDHRIVMALALAGLVADGQTMIDTAEAAAVTYPHFVRDFQALGAYLFMK